MHSFIRHPNLLVAALVTSWPTSTLLGEDSRVGPPPESIRAEFRLAPFYKKCVSAGGVPIVASEKVSDFALLEARFLIEQMIGHRPDVLAAIAKNQVRLVVMAPGEFTTDIPEHSDLRPKDYWDWRARGLGATPVRPAVSCGEENLLGYPGDPYATENILIHEFGHVIHERGLSTVDPTFDDRLNAAFQAAKRDGLWKDKYAGTNRMEYWAEGVQSWFDTNRENDFEHNHVNTRAEIKEYDLRLAALLVEAFGDMPWRYTHVAKRVPPSPHLTGYDPTGAPRFTWPERLVTAKQRFRDGAHTMAPADALPLPALGPKARDDWRSPSSEQRTSVFFQNSTPQTVRLDWIDFDGRPKNYYTLRQGEHAESSTFAGHVWRASDESGKVLGYFVADQKTGTAVVKAAP